MAVKHAWRFVYDDGVWDCCAVPPVDGNLSRAIETLADSFGTQASRVRFFLDYWKEVSDINGMSAPVNVTTASVHPVDGGRVQIRDKYGQFNNVEIEAEDLEAALLVLMEEMGRRFKQINVD